ncbi:universal stress protein [Bradyrhizobium erythrophlei]|jgi:nucleotide-binding universal stress UspA family protein|uniref:Nucleotide-binding universal stress protein, UspA family n=1 Tax=Bradyrhizobium erythrophlei TaxID=1437360 RepID=A0A1M5PPQ0_9BRAD|nr:universal stress protein [Bradyrhizobium erythrophlei]SHH03757.1 Nucleotide-binding universal stress protein, UspA family [Bradyrhizobium erythrophlei]
MTLKSIGVFVDATPEGEKRIDYAAALAHRCDAHLAGIHVVSAVRPEYRSDYYVIGEKAIRAALASQKAADEAVTSDVRRRFEAISAKRDLRAEFRVIRRGGPDDDLTLNSLHSDLVVIGQRELQELRGYTSPEKLLLSSGAPILVIPSGWKSESIGNKILVGWNASREARRAVADALPFLVAASSVTLLVVDSEQRAGRHGEEPGADIALYLTRHGARVEIEQVLSQGSPVADVILSCAAAHGMDLIVIGAYSHARSVEMLFGGVTRTLLKLAPVPLLMSR